MILRAIVVAALVLAGSSALAAPALLDAPPEDDRPDFILAAELALTGGSVVAALHNGRLAYSGNRSLGWSLAGLAIGAGTLALAATDEAHIAPIGVVAGLAAVITSAARLPRPGDTTTVRRSGGGLRLGAGLRGLAVHVGF